MIAAGAALAVSAYGARAAFARPGRAGTLHYYNWIDYVNPETYAAFTKATGIKVRKSYFVSNEALWTRLTTGGRGYDLAAPTGYMVARLSEDGLLAKIDWKKLPTVRRNIDPKFLGLPYDPKNEWSVPKDWGTTGFMYRTDKIKQRPVSWAQFFALFEKYPKRFTILDGSAEVVGSVAAMMGYSYNTDSERELEKIKGFLLDLKPYIHSIDSVGYKDAIATGKAYGGLGWNGDGAYVIAHSPNNAADYVVAREGGELWVDAHVIPKGATNAKAAHAWIDFVYQPKRNAAETLYTYFGSPLKRSLLSPLLTPSVMRNPDLFPPSATFRQLEASNVTPRGTLARERIWAELKRRS